MPAAAKLFKKRALEDAAGVSPGAGKTGRGRGRVGRMGAREAVAGEGQEEDEGRPADELDEYSTSESEREEDSYADQRDRVHLELRRR